MLRKRFMLIKQLMDIVGGTIALIVFTPVMLLCAAMIKIADPAGPVMFRQTRVGLNGRLITVFKLRSMYVNAEACGTAQLADKDDPRVIPCCRWMRRSHVDELPQLWNIVMGHMSLVGPRPERPEIFNEMTKQLPGYEQRIAVKPGLTGLAQIKNGYDTGLESMRRKLDYDLQYIREMSLWHELQLLAATVTKFNDTAAR